MNRVLIVIGLLISNMVLAGNPVGPDDVKCAAGEQKVINDNFSASPFNNLMESQTSFQAQYVMCINKNKTAKVYLFAKNGDLNPNLSEADFEDEDHKLVLVRVLDLNFQKSVMDTIAYQNRKGRIILSQQRMPVFKITNAQTVIDTEALFPEYVEEEHAREQAEKELRECMKTKSDIECQ